MTACFSLAAPLFTLDQCVRLTLPQGQGGMGKGLPCSVLQFRGSVFEFLGFLGFVLFFCLFCLSFLYLSRVALCLCTHDTTFTEKVHLQLKNDNMGYKLVYY